ncbi:plasmid partition protein [Streptomyces triticagri]|uniref:Plasmid partition protein n=1 Tax=Streptomyces triticagri TaxID=2293568 RepID=A0A372LY96_9ACTN|nr:plasmid partition protein [Streptomyces triticagri]RFU83632.1 plasmid partition protein [Streptomyces triticagri]
MLIASLKPRTMGGTTNSGLLAYALHRAGYPVACYDADDSQQLFQWSLIAEDFPCKVHEAATSDFARSVYPAMDPDAVNVVDVGHAENHPGVVDAVLEVADCALVTFSPTSPDFARLTVPDKGTPLSKMIARSAVLRTDGQAPPTAVLLNRCPAGSPDTRTYRQQLGELGWDVLSVTVPRKQALANAVNNTCEHPDRRGPFDELVTELGAKGRGWLPW